MGALLDRIMADGYPSRIVDLRGVKVRVRGQSIAESQRFASHDNEAEGAQHAILSLCTDPETGEPVFAFLEEVRALPLSLGVLLKEAIDELSVLDHEAVEAEGKDSSIPSPAIESS